MKVRIGIGAGRGTVTTETLGELFESIASCKFDSIWLSENLTGGGLDPFVGLAWGAAYVPTVKLGTTMLLPGRNVVRLAKALATLDRLARGRLFVTFVPGVLRSPEREAIGIAPRDRATVIEEALPLLRRLLDGDMVSHDGLLGRFENVAISPRPIQQPMEFWLGGMAPAALERCGRFGDGWLPSSCTPAEVAAARVVIEEAAARSGRQIDPEHFGVSLNYLSGPPTAEQQAQLAERAKGRDPSLIVPESREALRQLIERFLEVGFSKFVVRPLGAVESWRDELGLLAAAVGDLQN
jgi:probable F420-dependent oxidoreductase